MAVGNSRLLSNKDIALNYASDSNHIFTHGGSTMGLAHLTDSSDQDSKF